MSSAALGSPVPGDIPLLGHAPALLRDPLGFVASLPAHGALVRLRLGRQPVVAVCDPELTRKVLLDDRTFDKGGPLFERVQELLGNGLGTCPHQLHRRQRRLCQPAFQQERLRAYLAVMAAETQAAVDSWHDGQVIDVTTEMMTLTARAAVATMFSSALPSAAVDLVVADFTTLLDAFIRRVITPQPLLNLPTPANRRYNRALNRLRGTVAKIIAVRRAEGGDHGDLLSALMAATDRGTSSGLSDTELADQVLTFFIAGTEPTAATVAFAVHLLATHPQAENSTRAEADRVLHGRPVTFEHLPALTQAARVITETLRLYPPGWLFTRTVVHDTELGGTFLPAGATLAYSPYLIQRRPDLYIDPDRFAPDRWLHTRPDRAAYVPFGAGPRKCIGERFALIEAVVALVSIISRWRLIPLSDKPLRIGLSTTISPSGLRMRVTDRGLSN